MQWANRNNRKTSAALFFTLALSVSVLAESNRTQRSSIDELLMGLKNPDRLVRELSAKELRHRGPEAINKSIPILAEQLKSDDFNVRASASGSFIDLGPLTIPSLISLSKDPNTNVRIGAIYALGGMGPLATDAVPSLIQCLDDSNWTVQYFAATALGQIGPLAKSAAPRLERLTQLRGHGDDKPGIRRALKEVNGIEPYPILLDSFHGSGLTGTRTLLAFFTYEYDDPTRKRALQIMREKDPDVVKHLVELLVSAQPVIMRDGAIKALKWMTPSVVAQLIEARDHANDDGQVWIDRALKEIAP